MMFKNPGLLAYLCPFLDSEAAVEPAVNGRSTSVLCSISSHCVIARVDMCSEQITEKWLRPWQRETAPNRPALMFQLQWHVLSPALSLWESGPPFSNTCRRDRAEEEDGRERRGERSSGWKLSGYVAIIRAGLWLIDLTSVCRSLPHSTLSRFWDCWIMQMVLSGLTLFYSC